MKISIYTLFFCLTLYINTNSQTTITGFVTDSLNKPIPFANVYLSKTTFGTVTDSNGKYSLKIDKDGYYQLIASCVGYYSHEQNIYADGKEYNLNVKLSTHYIRLSEVTVKSSERLKKKYYKLFVKQFIGESPNSFQCKILNMKDLHLYIETQTDILKGFSVKPLKIENKALGYNIICELKDYSYNPEKRILNFVGNYYFEPLTGSKRKTKKWQNTRFFTYKGSRMHFIRALYSDLLKKENFEISETPFATDKNHEITNSLLPTYSIVRENDKFSKTLFYEKPVSIIHISKASEFPHTPFSYQAVGHISNIFFQLLY